MRCPACWSTIEDTARLCPVCNTRVRGRMARWMGAIAVVLAAAGGVGALWWNADLLSAVRGESEPESAASSDPATPPDVEDSDDAVEITDPVEESTAPPIDAMTGRGTTAAVWLGGSDGRSQFPALAIDAAQPGQTLLLLAAEYLPLHGSLEVLEDRDRLPLESSVVTDAPDLGFTILLVATEALPERVASAQPAQTPLPPPGREVPLTAGGPGTAVIGPVVEGGRRRIANARPGSVVFEGGGSEKVLGIVTADETLLPVSLAATWWRQRPIRSAAARSLAVVQEMRRANDPSELLRAAAATAADERAGEAELREAFDRVVRSRALAFDADLLRQADGVEQAVLFRLVDLFVAQGREGEGLALIEQVALGRGAASGPIVGWWVVLAARASAPERALDLLRRHSAQLPDGSLGDQARSEVVTAVLATLADDPPRGAALLERAWAILPGDRRLAAARAQIEAEAERAARAAAEAAGGRRVEVPIRNGVAKVDVRMGRAGTFTYIVDTGASVTTIPSAVADRLRLRGPSNRPVRLTTASGTVDSVIVTVPELVVGSIVLRNVPAAVLDLPDTNGQQGLLGLDALQRLRVEIDDQRGVLVLEQRR